MSDSIHPPEPPPPPQSPPPPPRSPFDAPQSGGDGAMPLSHAEVCEKLKVPAILMMVLAILAFLMSFSGLFVDQSAMMEGYIDIMQPFMEEAMAESGQDWEEFKEQMLSNATGPGAMGKAMTVFQLLMYLAILGGSLMMLKGKNYGFSVVAVVLSSIPCFGPCCCLGMIPGIWALVILFKPEIRAGFQ